MAEVAEVAEVAEAEVAAGEEVAEAVGVEAQRDRHQRGHTKTWGRSHRRIDIHFHRGLRRNAG